MSDYRESHLQDHQVRWYEKGVYAEGSFDNWLWALERPYLLNVLERRFRDRDVRLLDFACGTGRILAFLEPHVAEATGIDISERMLEIARTKVTHARLLCGDVTRDPSVLAGPYDVVTAFRFFLNAEDKLRHEVLERLRDALEDDGVLILNIHGNSWSIRLPAYLVRRYLRKERISQLSYRQVSRMLRHHGFRVLEFRGVGLLNRRTVVRLGATGRERAERLLTRFPPLQYLAIELIIVAGRDDRVAGR